MTRNVTSLWERDVTPRLGASSSNIKIDLPSNNLLQESLRKSLESNMSTPLTPNLSSSLTHKFLDHKFKSRKMGAGGGVGCTELYLIGV